MAACRAACVFRGVLVECRFAGWVAEIVCLAAVFGLELGRFLVHGHSANWIYSHIDFSPPPYFFFKFHDHTEVC